MCFFIAFIFNEGPDHCSLFSATVGCRHAGFPGPSHRPHPLCTSLSVGHGGVLVETTPFDRRVGFRTLLYPLCRDLGQVLHLELPLSLLRVNSDTVSIAVVGNASERSGIKMDKYNTI